MLQVSASTRKMGLPGEAEVRSAVEAALDAVLAGSGDSPPTPAHSSRPSTPESSPQEAIAIGADHGGFPLKEKLAFKLRELGHTVLDCGTNSHDSVDYPDFAHAVAEKVASGEARWGIVVDGAGIGSAMVANKVPGVRAALCYDLSSARNSREHNHANVLTLGAGLIGASLAWQIVQEWLATDWGGDRHARRIEKIDAIERRYLKVR